jgi:hypothetical protein
MMHLFGVLHRCAMALLTIALPDQSEVEAQLSKCPRISLVSEAPLHAIDLFMYFLSALI